jgi:nitrate reductase gamma subunit
MGAIFSLFAVVVLVLLGLLGANIGLQSVFGIAIPYLAVILFVGGFIYRILKWAKSPVPFRIPTTCGQQKSLSFIKQDKLESPSTFIQVVGRMALEILFSVLSSGTRNRN